MGELVVWSAKNLKYNPFQLDHREFLLNGRMIQILQSPGIAIGTVVWDSVLLQDFRSNLKAYVLCKYLEDNFPKDYFQNKRILEIGSGTGLVGIFCSLLGANVIMTDLKDILPTIERNVLHNLTTSSETQTTENGFCKAQVLHMPTIAELEWGENVSKFCNFYNKVPFDFIIASDVVYEPATFEPLLHTLKMVTGDSTEVIMGYKQRYEREKKFFYQLERMFDVRKVEKEKLMKEYQDSSSPNCVFHIKNKELKT